MQQLTTYLQCLILDNNNIIDMIDNFISEFSITNSWNAEKWSRLMEDVKNMTDGDSRKRSMRKLRAIVFAANKFILNKGNYVTIYYTRLRQYGAPSAPKSIKKPKYRRRFLSYGGLTPRRKITKPTYNQKRSNKRSRVYEEQRQNITYRNAA